MPAYKKEDDFLASFQQGNDDEVVRQLRNASVKGIKSVIDTSEQVQVGNSDQLPVVSGQRIIGEFEIPTVKLGRIEGKRTVRFTLIEDVYNEGKYTNTADDAVLVTNWNGIETEESYVYSIALTDRADGDKLMALMAVNTDNEAIIKQCNGDIYDYEGRVVGRISTSSVHPADLLMRRVFIQLNESIDISSLSESDCETLMQLAAISIGKRMSHVEVVADKDKSVDDLLREASNDLHFHAALMEMCAKLHDVKGNMGGKTGQYVEYLLERNRVPRTLWPAFRSISSKIMDFIENTEVEEEFAQWAKDNKYHKGYAYIAESCAKYISGGDIKDVVHILDTAFNHK